MADVDLAFIGRQLERVLEGQAQARDEIFVLLARIDRLDASVRGVREELHALTGEVAAIHQRHSRSERRLERVEERVSQL